MKRSPKAAALLLSLLLLTSAAIFPAHGQALNSQFSPFGPPTANDIAVAIQTSTGCTTAGYVWVPASNTCVAQGGGPGGSVQYTTVRTTSAATDTIVPADCTAGGNLVTYTNASSVAITLPVSGLTAGCRVGLKALGTSGSSLVITPASGNIDLSTSLTVFYPGDAALTWTGSTWTAQGGYGVRGASTLISGAVGSLTKVTSPGSIGPAIPGTDYPTLASVTTAQNAAGNAQATANNAIPVGQKGASGGVVPIASDGSVPYITPIQIAALWEFGDSYTQCYGATDTKACAMALIAAGTPAPTYNYGVGGTTQPQIAARTFALFAPTPLQKSVTQQTEGANDGLHDTCGGTATTACAQNYRLSLDATIGWTTIPVGYRIMASNATQGGGSNFSADTTLPMFTSAILASIGTPMKSSTSGNTLTFSIPSSASTVLGLTYEVTNSQTGTFTVSMDGVLQTDASTGSTTWTSGPSQAGTGTAVALYGTSTTLFRQYFTVTPNQTHTVVVTNTSTNLADVVSVDWVPPASVTYQNARMDIGPNPTFQYASVYDGISLAVTTAERNLGLQSYFASQVNGTPGTNATTDISTTATATCPASTFSTHLNDCGQLKLAQTVDAAETAAGFHYSYFYRNAGPTSVAQGPPVWGTINPGGSTTLAETFANGNAGTVTPAVGIDFYRSSTNRAGFGNMNVDASTGQPWSGAYNTMAFNSINGTFFCVTSLASSTFLPTSVIPASSYVCKYGVRHSDGASYQLGPAGAPVFQSAETTQTSTTTAIPIGFGLVTITLAGNYVPTWAAPSAFTPTSLSLSSRQCIQFVQDATGGRTVTWPANVLGGFTPTGTAAKRSMQCFDYSPSQTAYVAESVGLTNY